MFKTLIVLGILFGASNCGQREMLEPGSEFYKPVPGDCFFLLDGNTPVHVCNVNGTITKERMKQKIKRRVVVSCTDDQGCITVLQGSN